jgi:predicted alpha/beta-fold hydrolase
MKTTLVIILCILFIVGCKKADVVKVTPPAVAEVKVPKLLTNDITDLTFYSVVFSGKLLDSAGEKITEYGFVVDTVTAPTTIRNFNKFPMTIRKTDGSFILNVTDLPSSVTYYVRAYAI